MLLPEWFTNLQEALCLKAAIHLEEEINTTANLAQSHLFTCRGLIQTPMPNPKYKSDIMLFKQPTH
jgi:hypothetical protein